MRQGLALPMRQGPAIALKQEEPALPLKQEGLVFAIKQEGLVSAIKQLTQVQEVLHTAIVLNLAVPQSVVKLVWLR
jgi:hypothetical protein